MGLAMRSTKDYTTERQTLPAAAWLGFAVVSILAPFGLVFAVWGSPDLRLVNAALGFIGFAFSCAIWFFLYRYVRVRFRKGVAHSTSSPLEEEVHDRRID